MFKKGDIVVRVTAVVEGGFKKGTRAIVKEVHSATEMTLEGHAGIYLQSSFKIDTLVPEQIRQVYDFN